MSSDPTSSASSRPPPTVFLSYASEDRKAAQALRDALPGYGLEVWYDESGLDGGDAWDQKIRRQIRECDFFMPVISAQTEVRPEGYFRREWRFAVERTLDMADDHTFILPVVIDDTPQTGARVPDKFLEVQWMRVPAGQPTPALETRCRRLVAREPSAAAGPRRGADAPAPARPRSAVRAYPEFPREEPGQRVRFWFHVVGWAFKSLWVAFLHLPKWVRILIYCWLGVLALSKGCSNDDGRHERLSAADAKKIRQIADNYQGGMDKTDVSRLGEQVARELVPAVTGKPARNQILAIPFSVTSSDPLAQKVARATFAQAYGQLAVLEKGAVDLATDPLPALDATAAAAHGRDRHVKYVLYGGIDPQLQPPTLRAQLITADRGTVEWSVTYPLPQADPEQIAADLAAKVRELVDDE
jgi:TolB-like protein